MDFTKVIANLKDNGFSVSLFENKEEAVKYLSQELTDKSIGFGGSMTLKEMGLYEELTKNNTVYWHWEKQGSDIYKASQTADVYISSVNALSETGEIINIDGTCNRVSAIMYGHEKVYLIIGKNKIAGNYDNALFRARNIAAPLNAKRLSRNTPCAKNADKCYDCNSPDRICRGLSVLWKKPGCGEYEIILINENLGY